MGARMMALRIELPLPDKRLWPNSSKPASLAGKIGLGKKKAKARWDARQAATAAWRHKAGWIDPPRWEKATIRAVWRSKGKVDPDNIVAALKHYCDGLADA